MTQKSLAEILAQNTKVGELYKTLSDSRIECYACGHRCPIPEGKSGVCRIRFNKSGKLYVPSGYVAGLQDDPIEKKPFYHTMPGSRAMSFGMLGCDMHCSFCQNWITSQALRDSHAGAPIIKISAKDIVKLALERHCPIVTSTYNEPLITSEWAVEVFKEAKKEGLVTSYVSNGNATPEVLDYLKPWLDLFNVDLKCFDDKRYRELGCPLENVLRTIRALWEQKFWMEIVTLLVPGFNDSEEELKKLTEFIVSVSPDIPWHCTAFHADYKMTDHHDTRVSDLIKAGEIGKKAGLKYVYLGNLPGMVGEWENTYCPDCHELLIERMGFHIVQNKLTATNGKCGKCGSVIAGFWGKKTQI